MTGEGDYLYVVDDGGLRVVDASVRTAPAIIATVPGVTGQLMDADAGRVYVSAITAFYIVDVSSPTQPTLLGTVGPFPYFVEALAVDGNRVYTGFNYEGTGVVDLYDYTDPNDRQFVASEAIPWVSNLCYRNGTLYASGMFHVSALDGTTLNTESSVGVHAFGGASYRSGLRDTDTGRVAVMGFWGGFHLFRDDGMLSYLGSGSTPATGSTAIADGGDYVYVTDSTGLHVYEAPPVVTGVDVTIAAELPGLHVAPNPARDGMRFAWDSPAGREPAEIRIFDVHGRLVRALRADDSGARREISWDGRDRSGEQLPAGVFYARLTTGVGAVTRALQIVR